MNKILAIIPARANSKRLPEKNKLPFLGKPLVAWSIEFAMNCRVFSRVVLSTDDPEILDIGSSLGIDNPGLRPANLSSDTSSTADVIIYELLKAEKKFGEFDYVAVLQPTSPFRMESRWYAAVEKLSNFSNLKSVVSVNEVSQSPFHMFTISEEATLKSLFPRCLSMRSQDLNQAYIVNGALYLAKAEDFKFNKTFFGKDTAAVICSDPEESVDIDTLDEFQAAEQLLKEKMAHS